MGSDSSFIYILLAFAALFVAVLLPRLRRRRAEPSLALGSFADRTADARAQLEQLLAEIQDLSREHIARLDTKIRVLNQLLLDCDRRQKELEALLGRAAAAPAPASPSAARPSNPLHHEVYTLQDAGKDLNDICAATGLEKGEVELILGLRRMPPAAP